MQALELRQPLRPQALPRAAVVLLWSLLATGCVTRRAAAPVAAVAGGSDTAAATAGDDSAAANGGYFVALSAIGASAEALALYDRLADVVDGVNRKQASEAGELSDYLEEFQTTGFARIADDDNEIECDRQKCLVKLSSRQLAAASATSLPRLLTEGMALKGVKPEVRGTGTAQSRTYVLGGKPGMTIACEQRGFGSAARYLCRFDLARTLAAVSPAVQAPLHGQLVSCSLSPGTVRSAEEAKADLEGGGLVALAGGDDRGPNGKTVGFLRYTRDVAGRSGSNTVELVDLFLCGDLPADQFPIEGRSKSPAAWVAEPPAIGAIVSSLAPLEHEDARLLLTPKIAGAAGASYSLQVRVRLTRSGGELLGEDQFYVQLPKAWLNRQ